jgi:hypothetical protein
MTHPDLRHLPLAVVLSFSCADKSGRDSDTWCFIGSTLVDTPTGPRRIDALRPGDPVWSWNRALDLRVARPVERVLPATATELWMVPTDQGWISGVTASHPFAVSDDRAWVAVSALRVGDRLERPLSLGVLPVVTGLPMRVPTAMVAVYDLSVQGPEHNFVADGWLAHNKSIDSRDSDEDGYYTYHISPQNVDCNDADPTIHPGATEVCDDAVDNDCDDLVDGSDPDCGAARNRPAG